MVKKLTLKVLAYKVKSSKHYLFFEYILLQCIIMSSF
jgi:hypothetical protein